MAELKLTFASGESSLSVRRFHVQEWISGLFTIEVMARSLKADIDLGSIVGDEVTLRLDSGKKHVSDSVRSWTGICCHMDISRAVEGKNERGESTYHLQIVPKLWLLTQRTNHRIFQHQSVPDIVDTILKEWSIEPAWKIQRASYPKLEYRCQYGESDYDFVARLLAEAGICFTFPDDAKEGSTLTLWDRIEQSDPRKTKIHYVDNPNQAAELEFVTDVELVRRVAHGGYAVRDFDFRNPAYNALSMATAAPAPENRYEVFEYRPGVSLVEVKPDGTTPVADEKGAARHHGAAGAERAERALGWRRVDRDAVDFVTNTTDLWPGVVYSIERHPHGALGDDKRLLVTAFELEGTPEGEWTSRGRAVFADHPYLPPELPKPVVDGVQSAVVVGKRGEEIDTDEFGRVKVQFPWWRDGKSDDSSSCWVRVAQGWAGAGFGFIAIPRIGQEVLVGFLAGDPDCPIITGRVFNKVQPVPYKLPEHKTRSTWRSQSTPDGEGSNELMFEDRKGSELVYVQAEKNLRKIVKNDEVLTVGQDRDDLVKRDQIETTKRHRTEVTGGARVEHTDGDRTAVVGKNEARLVKGDAASRVHGNQRTFVAKTQHTIVAGDRVRRVEKAEHVTVDKARATTIGAGDSLSVGGDRHVKVDGRHALAAKKEIHVAAGTSLVIEAERDLTLKGPGGFIKIDPVGVTIKGNLVMLNSGTAQPSSGSGCAPTTPEAAATAKIDEPAKPEPDDVSVNGLAQ